MRGILCISLLAALGLASPGAAAKTKRKSLSRLDPDWQNAPSARYATLGADDCRAELDRRDITWTLVERARGVRAPVRIPQGVRGVQYRTLLPEEKRLTNPHDVFDCRLVLALDDLSKILVAHDIDDVVIFSSWRPPARSWPHDKEARRHPGALAVDVMRLGKTVDGKRVWLDVQRDFNGEIGAETCGPRAKPPAPATEGALELRAIFCQAAAQRLFTSMLSPNYNQPHFNHFHLEITPDVKWQLAR